MNTYMKNKHTGEIAIIKSGFDWGVVFFGWVYYLFRGLTGKAILYFFMDILVAICTFGFGNIVLAIYRGNNFKNEYREYLIKNDYEVVTLPEVN